MAFLLVTVFAAYAGLLLWLLLGWAKVQETAGKPDGQLRTITVVVPFRNEQRHLTDLLTDLASQNYPAEKWNAILVDDHSTDRSTEVVARFNFPGKVIRLQGAEGKKAALTAGIRAADGLIIATTDADVRLSPSWLAEINGAFSRPETKMVVGPVSLAPGNTWFQRLQWLEFASLAGVTAAGLGWGVPVMCNGANLAFLKPAFEEVEGYAGNAHISSGDDEFLMRKVAARWRGSVKFLFSGSAIAVTQPLASLSSFIHQRVRWAGKWKHNNSLSARLMAVFIALFHIGFLVGLVAAGCGLVEWKLFGWLWLMRFFGEAVFLLSVTGFLQQNANTRAGWSWVNFLALQFLYSLYVVAIGFASLVVRPKWKGRAVQV
ncbi:MAG: glycosyltransferase [Bacteroidota bacterium]